MRNDDIRWWQILTSIKSNNSHCAIALTVSDKITQYSIRSDAIRWRILTSIKFTTRIFTLAPPLRIALLRY